MRHGVNLKYTHTKEEILNGVLKMRECRHITPEALEKHFNGYGLNVCKECNSTIRYCYCFNRMGMPSEKITFFDPPRTLQWIGMNYGFSCVICSRLTKPEEKWSGRTFTFFYENEEPFRVLSGEYKSASPVCDECQASFRGFMRRKKWYLIAEQYDSSHAQICEKAFEVFSLEWLVDELLKSIANIRHSKCG